MRTAVARALLANAAFAERLAQEGDFDRAIVLPAPAVLDSGLFGEILISHVDLLWRVGPLFSSDGACDRVDHVEGVSAASLGARCTMSSSSRAFDLSALMHRKLSAHEGCCMKAVAQSANSLTELNLALTSPGLLM